LGELLYYDYLVRKNMIVFEYLSPEMRGQIVESLKITPEILRTNLSILRKNGLLKKDKLLIRAEYLESLTFEFYEKIQ
jgi:hypothetical protein